MAEHYQKKRNIAKKAKIYKSHNQAERNKVDEKKKKTKIFTKSTMGKLKRHGIAEGLNNTRRLGTGRQQYCLL